MVERMFKKGLVVGIIVLFIGIAIASSININIVKASSDSNYVKVTIQTGESEIIKRESITLTPLDGPVELIDQLQYTNCGWGVSVRTRYWEAQSFTPTFKTLTKIKVEISKTSYDMPSDINITLHVRDSLTGEDIVNLSKEPGPIGVPWDDYNFPDKSIISRSRYYLIFYTKWLEYDFPDVTVIPGNKYYIILESEGGTLYKHYLWVFQRNNGYKAGEAWNSSNSGVTWTLDEDPPDGVGLDCCFITYVLDEPPNIPTIDGPITGKPGTPYTYTFTSIDPEGHNISYYINWGDGNITDWTIFNVSGTGYSESYIWAEKGTYTIGAKTRDSYSAESDWGTLKVTMPRTKATKDVMLLRILERFPLLQRLLNNWWWNIE